MRWKDAFAMVRDTAWGFSERQPFTLGAALAFYGVFALAPTLIIAIALAGVFFGEEAAKGQLDATLTDALGPTLAQYFTKSMTSVHVSGSGWVATAIGVVLILVASTGVFIQLQTAFNDIWGVQPKPGRGFWAMVRCRFFAFVLVLSVGALLVLSLLANAFLLALRAYLPAGSWPTRPFLWDGVNWLLSLVLLTLLVAMMYKLLPDAIIGWRDVWVSAFITALLVAAGNYLFGQYLAWAGFSSDYGSASYLVVVLLWVFYSSQILLFGAEFTKHFANRCGKPVRPAEYAMSRPFGGAACEPRG
jgi:membrane protein